MARLTDTCILIFFISALGDLKLKQEERKVTPPEQTDEDSSESSDTESSDSDEKSPATSASAAEEATVAEAPVELKGEVHG